MDVVGSGVPVVRPLLRPGRADQPSGPPRHDEAPDGVPHGSEAWLWHVTLTASGPAVEPTALREGLLRLSQEHLFLVSVRYAADVVELRYWDEAENIDDAAAMALRLWGEHRQSAGLPAWPIVGLEVVDQATVYRRRGAAGPGAEKSLVLGEVRPI